MSRTFEHRMRGMVALNHPSCKHCRLGSSTLLTYKQLQMFVSQAQIEELCSELNTDHVMEQIKHSVIAIGFDANYQFRGIVFGRILDKSAYIDVICSKGCGACITNHFIELARLIHGIRKAYIVDPVHMNKLCTYVNWGFDKVDESSKSKKLEYTGTLHNFTVDTLPKHYKVNARHQK